MTAPEQQPEAGSAAIFGKLNSFRRRGHLRIASRNLLLIVTAYTAVLLAALLLEAFLQMGTTARTALFWLLHGGAAFLILAFVAPSLLVVLGFRQGETELDTARRLGERIPAVKDHLLNALQLMQDQTGGTLYSNDLRRAAVRQAFDQMKDINIRKLVDFRTVRTAAVQSGFSVLTVLLLLFLFSDSLQPALGRVFAYGTTFRPAAPFALEVSPGNAEFVKGTDIPIIVRVTGKPDTQVRLYGSAADQGEFYPLKMAQENDSLFRHDIEAARSSIDYYAASGEVVTPTYRIHVMDPPVIRTLRLTVTPPAYSGLARHELDDHAGDVTGLAGTTVSFLVESSKDLSSARLVFSDSTTRPLTAAGTRATGEIRLTRSVRYHLELRDEEDLANRDPVEYLLNVVRDEAPRVALEVPGRDLDVAGNEQLPLVMRLSDDYGFSDLHLAYRLTASRYEQPAEEETYVAIPLPQGIGSSGIVTFNWPLDQLSLVPEDVITYFVEVKDNDRVSGPKTGRSELYRLRLPSLDEVFARLDDQHEAGIDQLETALRNVEKAKSDLRTLEEELRKNPESADWQEQRRADQLQSQYEDIQKTIAETADLLNDMMKEMEKNAVLSPETLQKYSELQELLQELNSPDLLEALKRLQDSMRKLSPEEMLAAMENLNLTEEQFRQSIERTMNLLKRIQIEQKVDEAVRRMEEMIRNQETLNKQTEQADQSGNRQEAETTAEEQEKLAAQMEMMKELLKTLETMMAEFPSEMPLEELNQAMSQLDSAGMADQMKALSEQMRNMQMQQAMSGQEQMLSSMQQLSEMLKQMQQAMLSNQQQQIVNGLRGVYQDLLDLSAQQEAMKNESKTLHRSSPLFRERTAEQMELLQNLSGVTDRLTELSRKTFGVTPEMGKAIGDAMSSMAGAMNELGARNGEGASRMQEGAMGSLNEAAQQVQGSLQAMMQAPGQGMGMGGLMGQLQRMTEMQRGINQGTQNLGAMGQQGAAEMARLAGEQGRARKSLEQLAREASRAGELSRLLGDLNKTAQEMREVQTDLAQGAVRPETIQKQDRILSRLLDSQRSMKERDYEKKRKAETARAYDRTTSPGDLSTTEARERLRQDLLKAMEQGYSTDYKSIIRRYFDLLEQTGSPE